MANLAEDNPELWTRARELARGRGERLSTLHLLGALADGHGPARGLLASHGVDGTWIRLRAAGLFEHPEVVATAEAAAARFAAQLKARSVGEVHLLAALLRLDESVARRVLHAGGIDIEAFAAAVHGFLTGAARWRSRARTPTAPPQVSSRMEPARGGRTLPAPRPRPLPATRPAPAPSTTTPSATLSPGAAAQPEPAPPVPRPTAPAPRPVVRRPPTPEPERPAGGPRRTPAAMPAARPARAVSPKSRPKPTVGPWLTAHARDLRRAAAEGRFDPAVAREDVVARLRDVLQKRRASSPCLVGLPGVGKSAVVHALAAPSPAADDDALQLLEVPLGAWFGGPREGAAERIRRIADEARGLGTRVVFAVGDLGAFVRAVVDAGDGADAALRDALEARAFAVLAETDPAGWERALRLSPVLARCFGAVEVGEPDDEAARRMVEAVVPRYAEHHGVEIAPAAVEAAVRVARRYLVGRALPDKALQLLDLAAARARRAGAQVAGAAEVAAVAGELVDVPAERLLATDGQRLLALEDELGRRIVGHRPALARVADVLRRNAAGFRGRRPIGSFLFLGPTGVGKTETARAVAESLFPGRENLLRLDMSEYAEPHAVARLVGAPPGYVGFEAGGLLSDALRRRPYQVVLLDEFEKAHPDVHRLFLQVLEDARLTDGRGQTIDFRNAVVVMTSNLGSELYAERRAVGFGRAADAPEANVVLAAARRALPPELWNRIDETLVFEPLGVDEIRAIARLLLQGTFTAAAAGRDVTVAADDELVDHLLAAGGYEPALGARPMRRAIQRLVEGPLARALLRPDLPRGARLRVGVRDGAVQVTAEPPTAEVACA
ncbi:MAG: AAA family ATPase [Deltaproteobacteria bacterium]|nr:AAA family ATPase [Deltaproteobacteria bacterium]